MPALVMGGAIMPAPLLAAKLAHTATIRPVIHPGDSAPEPRYAPSAGLARFVRCRDLTCRFPGCDAPADHCDIDHTIAYPVRPTQAANLKLLCRCHACEHIKRSEQAGGVPGYHHLSGPSRRHFCRSPSAARTAASLTR